VRSAIAHRCQKLVDVTFDNDALENLIQEIALHWMYYYIVNGFKVAISSGDVAHPQTRRIIRKHVERFLGSGEDTFKAGSVLFGVSAEEYKKGLQGDDYYDEMR